MGHADFDGRDVVVDGQCKVVNADFAGCIGAWDGCGCMQILHVARGVWDGESNFAGCEGGGVCGTSKLMFS